MKKFENPIMEIALFEAENVVTSSSVKLTAEDKAKDMLTNEYNAAQIKSVLWVY